MTKRKIQTMKMITIDRPHPSQILRMTLKMIPRPGNCTMDFSIYKKWKTLPMRKKNIYPMMPMDQSVLHLPPPTSQMVVTLGLFIKSNVMGTWRSPMMPIPTRKTTTTTKRIMMKKTMHSYSIPPNKKIPYYNVARNIGMMKILKPCINYMIPSRVTMMMTMMTMMISYT